MIIDDHFLYKNLFTKIMIGAILKEEREVTVIKRKRFEFSILVSIAITATSFTAISAASVISGTNWQTATLRDIPGGGTCNFATERITEKATSGNQSSLTGGTAAVLGMNTRLMSSVNSPATSYVPLSLTIQHPSINTTRGKQYFGSACTNNFEWSNDNDASMQYSADRLDSFN